MQNSYYGNDPWRTPQQAGDSRGFVLRIVTGIVVPIAVALIAYFSKGPLVQVDARPVSQQDRCIGADLDWIETEEKGETGAYKRHLRNFPDCKYAALAVENIKRLKAGKKASPAPQPQHFDSKESQDAPADEMQAHHRNGQGGALAPQPVEPNKTPQTPKINAPKESAAPSDKQAQAEKKPTANDDSREYSYNPGYWEYHSYSPGYYPSKKRMGIYLEADGRTINAVDADSGAYRAGLRPGDVLLQIQDQPISTYGDANRAVEQLSQTLDGVYVFFCRDQVQYETLVMFSDYDVS